MGRHLSAEPVPSERTEAEGESAFNLAASAGLFVGITSFEDKRIAAVPFAVDDAVDLAHLCALELGLVPPKRAVLLLAGVEGMATRRPSSTAGREGRAQGAEKRIKPLG